MIFDYPLTILEQHLDTYGHVNNATYLTIFEEARWDFITARGYGHATIMARRQGPIVLETHLKFLKELRLRTDVIVKSETISHEGKVGKIRQWIENEKGENCCEALFTIAFFDLNARKIIPPSQEWLRAIGVVV